MTTRTVQLWTEKGLPRDGTGRAAKYPLAECIEWRRTIDREEVEARFRPKSLDEARLRKLAAEAEITELDLMERRGELATIEDFDDVVTAGLGRMRAYGLGIPSRHARDFVGLKTVTAARNGLKQIVLDLFEAFHEMREEEEAA